MIRFAELYHGVPFNEAIALLRRWYGVGSLLGDMAKYYQVQLHRHPEAVAYLDQRGLHRPELIEALRIGYTAALDPRVKGVVSICGFTLMRTGTADRGTGGVARYSHERPLIPRLGFFIGHEAQIPYDFHEVLGAIAPRPVLVLQPEFDRDANIGDVAAAVEQAKKVYSLYGAAGALALHQPWDYNRLPNAQEDWAINWMSQTLH